MRKSGKPVATISHCGNQGYAKMRARAFHPRPFPGLGRAEFRQLPRIPTSWIRRRERRERRDRYQAIQRIGLATAGSPVAGETTLCIAYMCPWAHACRSATPRPALVNQRECLRRYAPERRPGSGLTDHALDTLAVQRERGVRLGAVTIAVLDQFRSAGPTRSFKQKRPARPVYDGRVAAL